MNLDEQLSELKQIEEQARTAEEYAAQALALYDEIKASHPNSSDNDGEPHPDQAIRGEAYGVWQIAATEVERINKLLDEKKQAVNEETERQNRFKTADEFYSFADTLFDGEPRENDFWIGCKQRSEWWVSKLDPEVTNPFSERRKALFKKLDAKIKETTPKPLHPKVQALKALVLTASDLAEEDEPPPTLLDYYSIRPGRPTAFVGYGGGGKTFFVIDLVIAIALQKTTIVWGDMLVTPQERTASVLHLNYETPKKQIKKRYQRIAFGRGIDLASLQDRVSVVRPNFYLDDDEAEVILTQACEGRALCIIDSFRAACLKTDENTSFARAPLDMLGRVSDVTNCVFVVIMHERKPGPNDNGAKKMALRGSSGLFDSLDTMISLNADEATQLITLTHEKASDAKKAENVVLEMKDVGPYDAKWKRTKGLVITKIGTADAIARETAVDPKKAAAAKSKLDAFVAKLVGIIKDAGPQGFIEGAVALRKLVDTNNGNATAVIKAALENGIIKDVGRKGGKAIYQLADVSKVTPMTKTEEPGDPTDV